VREEGSRFFTISQSKLPTRLITLVSSCDLKSGGFASELKIVHIKGKVTGFHNNRGVQSWDLMERGSSPTPRKNSRPPYRRRNLAASPIVMGGCLTIRRSKQGRPKDRCSRASELNPQQSSGHSMLRLRRHRFAYCGQSIPRKKACTRSGRARHGMASAESRNEICSLRRTYKESYRSAGLSR